MQTLIPIAEPPADLAASTAHAVSHFLAAAGAAGIDHTLHADRLPALARVFACSPYVAEEAARDPAAFVAMLNDTAPDTVRDAAHYHARCAALIAEAMDDVILRRGLRRFRHQELARIAWRDLTGSATLDAVLTELSGLADALVSASAEWLTRELAARYGTPVDAEGRPMSLIVIAMGKLGGGELNFSSDIDLMFVYRANGETIGGNRTLANQEYFDRLGKKLIAVLNDVTVDGFVYRVDMRLRPFGDSGALTASFAALEQYYQVHGRDWERYALIKARPLTGTNEDRAALEEITRPFVYRRYLDFGAFEAVREMKAMIDAEVARYGLERDIKRGAGGIREVEFIGQAFQLVRGGREPRLRLRQILPALRGCIELGLLDTADVTALTNAYIFLRVTEHRLQQVHDAQTQTLPDAPLEQTRLAYGLGFDDWASFAARLEGHRAAVRGCFASLLMPQPAPADDNEQIAETGARVWRAAADLDSTQEILVTAGFDDITQATAALGQLKDPRFLARLSSEARARLDRLMPPLVAACARQPDGAVALTRLAELVRAIARRSVYLALLADHGGALTRLVELCAASPWIAQQITLSPILLDELLDGRVLATPPGRAALVNLLDDAIDTADPGDLDRVMDVLRNFKHQQVLRVAACDLMADFPIAEVSNHLTWIAEVLVTKALALAWADLVARHGRPRVSDGARRSVGFGVIAYGKLGGLELGYGSDLDLVFVHDRSGPTGMTDGAKPIANDVFFTRLAQRLIHFITTRTPAGQCYEMDIRLRPSGASGLLVTSLEAFQEYQHGSAWAWEHQALQRARGVAGHPETLERFAAIRRAVLRSRREEGRLLADIVDMRERMRAQLDRSNAEQYDLKQGVGGITDIEFMVQYACLRWAAQHQILTAYTDNLRLLELIGDLGLLPREDCRALHDAYFAYRAEIHRCALQEVDGLVPQHALLEQREAVNEIWRHTLLQ